MSIDETLLCLDVGEVRVGVARANIIAGIAEPLTTIPYEEAASLLPDIMAAEKATTVVIGLPQNKDGQDTDQTRFVRDFVTQLTESISAEFVFQDEADSSKRAKKILQERGKTYVKEDIDAQAATLILQDYIEEQLPR